MWSEEFLKQAPNTLALTLGIKEYDGEAKKLRRTSEVGADAACGFACKQTIAARERAFVLEAARVGFYTLAAVRPCVSCAPNVKDQLMHTHTLVALLAG